AHLCCFSATSSPQIRTLSLHDALPILYSSPSSPPHGLSPSHPGGTYGSGFCRYAAAAFAGRCRSAVRKASTTTPSSRSAAVGGRSEEHTSELQSRENLVCRLLLENKTK